MMSLHPLFLKARPAVARLLGWEAVAVATVVVAREACMAVVVPLRVLAIRER
jgi:hypothetical protein